MIESLNIERRFSCWLEISERFADLVICAAEPIRPLSLDYDSICRATGMEYTELIAFLDSRKIAHSEFGIDFSALDALKEWYLKKMRRYLRNALAHGLEPGNAEEVVFYEFCREYSKFGHQEVKSWNDIDEERLLEDFVSKCLTDSFDSSRIYNVDATDYRAFVPDIFKFNLPRSASRHVFASWQKHLRYDQARYYYRY